MPHGHACIFVLHGLCLFFINPKCVQSQRLFPCVMVMYVETGHASMELAAMELYSALMAVMKSDVNDNQTTVLLRANFMINATPPTVCIL